MKAGLSESINPQSAIRNPQSHLSHLARERIAVLPACASCKAEIFEPPDGNFAEDRVNIHRQASSPGHLSGQQCRARMGEEIERRIAGRRTGFDDSGDSFERLL